MAMEFDQGTPQLHHDACGVGFLAELEGQPSTRLLPLALTALDRLAHRGAVDADGRTGDGAGVTTQIPYDVLRPELEARGLGRVAPRDLAVGLVFLPADAPGQARARQLLADAVTGRGLSFLGWREVPFRDEVLGDKARRSRPAIAQALVERPTGPGVTLGLGDDELEGALYRARREAEARAAAEGLAGFHVASLSRRSLVYKALVLLTLAGRDATHAMTLLVPPAWENDSDLSPEVRAFFEYQSGLMEPWDGPALLVFTDGRVVAAALDRNGLRPARSVVTVDGLVLVASEAREPLGSMGDDTPLAVLSTKARLLFSYFKQRFAQVTNPPIDPLRESLVMSLAMHVGPRGDLLLGDDAADEGGHVHLPGPLLPPHQLEALLGWTRQGWRPRRLRLVFPAAGGAAAFRGALDSLRAEAALAAREGAGLLVLSDRGVDAERAALPTLLPVSGVHQPLLPVRIRT